MILGRVLQDSPKTGCESLSLLILFLENLFEAGLLLYEAEKIRSSETNH